MKMTNWLAPLKRGLGVSGHLGMVHQDLRQIIAEGADIVMKQRRTDLMPRFHYEMPTGISVVNDEQMLEVFLAGMMARAVRTADWQTERFAYPAKKVSRIEQTAPWRALATGLGRHDCHPILLMERDVYCFNEMDWHVGQLKIGIGLG
ncbi:MAG: hypothetical protein ABL907_19970 [Hyphomicrobium sp.]